MKNLKKKHLPIKMKELSLLGKYHTYLIYITFLSLFDSNLSIKETTKSLTTLFQVFGEISSIRLRSVPVSRGRSG